MDGSTQSSSIVAEPAWLLGGYALVFPLVGAGVTWGLKLVAGWIADLAWFPFQGVFKLLADIDEPQATIVPLAVGAVAGLVLAWFVAAESLVVTVSPHAVTLVRGRAGTAQPTQEFPRASVDGVFVDGKRLVLLGRDGAELARESSDLGAAPLERAFRAHAYRWLDADPYAADFRRWVEDMPGLPAGADALLKARAKALSKGDDDDIRELRAELSRLGVYVREEKKKQYVRQVAPPPGLPDR